MFRRGVALLDAGDTERALEAFVRSREFVPSAKNTVNAAICLERLGRLDEALDMYEEVLARFAANLDEEDRKSLAPVTAGLRQRIGYLELSSNVDGLVVVDGRSRGRLPLTTALRLLPGERRVRVVKDGYRTFEQVIEVAAGRSTPLDAKLQPLEGLGAVRVESAAANNLEVFVDGVRIGTTPFEGIVSTGAHLLEAHTDAVGSTPELITVLAGRTLVVRVAPQPLGGPVTITSDPSTATLSLGAVPLGRGSWHGRLPLGTYVVMAKEPGYHDTSVPLVTPPAKKSFSLGLVLRKDPKHPRWPQRGPFELELEALLAPWFAPTLNADSERDCPSSCAQGPSAWGVNAALGAGVRHRTGWGGELLVGYAGFAQHFARVVREPFTDENTRAVATFLLDQQETAAGVTVALRGTLRRPLPFLGLAYRGALGAGLYVAHYKVSVDGNAFSNDGLVPITTSGPAGVWGVSAFVSAAIGLEKQLGSFGVHASLAALFFPSHGPAATGPSIGVVPRCDETSPPGAIGCAPQSNALANERVHGLFWAFTPELGVTYAF
jgi:PEGA domain